MSKIEQTHTLKEEEDADIKQTAKTLQFGSLIEQHMGSLDLKREMEKLKQLDEEQKRQKKVSLKIQCQANHATGATANQSQESPGKRILMGEFDEDKEEDDDLLYIGLGDD